MLEKYAVERVQVQPASRGGAIEGLGLVDYSKNWYGLHNRGAFGAAIIAGLLLIAVGAAPQPAPAPDQRQPSEAPSPPPEIEPVEHVKVVGFRSARWGMDAAQVKAAILKDFRIPAEKVKTEENAAERTTILTATVNDLLEGAGPGRVSYVLGYKTKKLIQVTILWGTPVDPHVHPDKVVTAANQLRQLFLDSGYQPETVVANARMADGTILVFQGQDADKHTTVLRLANTAAPANRRGRRARSSAITHAPWEKPPTTMRLSAISAARTVSRAASHASIAQLRWGSFAAGGSKYRPGYQLRSAATGSR